MERDDPSDRRSPGTLHICGAEGYLGSFRANANGFMGDTRGVPVGAYTLQPKRRSGNWPAQTPAVTGRGLPPGQPAPGYQPDSVLLHPEGRRGTPDSRACITVCATAFKLVMHIMHQVPGSKVPLVIR